MARSFAYLSSKQEEMCLADCVAMKSSIRVFLFLAMLTMGIGFTLISRINTSQSTFATTDSYDNAPSLDRNTNRTHATIVTCYFKMDSKHSHDEYLRWMTNMLSLSDNMVIFTTEDMRPTILELRAKLSTGKTKVITMTLQDTLMAKTYDANFWEHQFSLDPEKHKQHKSIDHSLYQVWNEKTNFLQTAAHLNPFGSEFFAWVDIGYFRTTTYNHQIMLDVIPHTLHRNQVLMLNVTRLVDGKGYIGGGFIGGYAEGIKRWHHLYYDNIKKHGKKLSTTFIGKDQPIMYQTCQETPGLCLLVEPPDGVGVGDPWFFMAPYLNKVTGPQLQGLGGLPNL